MLIDPRRIVAITDPDVGVKDAEYHEVEIEMDSGLRLTEPSIAKRIHLEIIEAWKFALERREVVVVRIDDRVSITTDADDYLDVRTRSDS